MQTVANNKKGNNSQRSLYILSLYLTGLTIFLWYRILEALERLGWPAKKGEASPQAARPVVMPQLSKDTQSFSVHEVGGFTYQVVVVQAEGKEQREFCVCAYYEGGGEDPKVRARHTSLALNYHGPLATALKNLLADLADTEDDRHPETGELYSSVAEAKAILSALAQEQAELAELLAEQVHEMLIEGGYQVLICGDDPRTCRYYKIEKASQVRFVVTVTPRSGPIDVTLAAIPPSLWVTYETVMAVSDPPENCTIYRDEITDGMSAGMVLYLLGYNSEKYLEDLEEKEI